jgi:hypothetical protein
MENIDDTDATVMLLNTLKKIDALAWWRCQRRIYDTWAKDHFEEKDYLAYPPFVAFRFENEKQEIVEKLKQATESYNGQIKWALHAHKRENLPGINWIIGASDFLEIENKAIEMHLAYGEYMARYNPKFASIAYEDLLKLNKHIQSTFANVLYK